MGLLVNCPLGASLDAIPIECAESVGQIQKFLVQRIYSAAGVKNKIVIGVADPNLLATWTALIAAADNTKILVTPYIQNPTSEAGAAREYGGGNETLGGIPFVVGSEPSTFTSNMLITSQKTIKEMKKLMTEEIGVYPLDEHGQIVTLTDDHDVPTEIYPIPINGVFVGDKTFGGLENPDMNAFNFRMNPNWSDMLHLIKPTGFNPLTDLVAP